MYFWAEVNNKYPIHAGDLATLKRKASRAANNDYDVMDKMTVWAVDNGQHLDPVYFYRLNQITPNNEIIRGKWR